MCGKRLLVDRVPLRVQRHAFAFILLALLALVSTLSVPALSADRIVGTRESVTQHSVLISQGGNASQLTTQGKQYYDAGQFDEAVRVWQKAAETYAQVGDKDGMTESLLNVAEAFQALGLYPRACNTLLQALEIAKPECQQLIQENKNRKELRDSLLRTLQEQPNSLMRAIGLRGLGDVLQRIDDDLDLSQKVLQLSLKVAQELPSPQDISAALLSLGNIERAKGNAEASQEDTSIELKPTALGCINKTHYGTDDDHYEKAAKFFQDAATESASPTTRIQAQLNHLSVLLALQKWSDAQDLLPRIQGQLKDLPSGRTAVYAAINFAQSMICLRQSNRVDASSWRQIAKTIATAVEQARTIGDQKAESYALGYLGALYEQSQQKPSHQDLSYAQNLTQEALRLARTNQARDIAYLWEWQLGHLLVIQGQIEEAIASYTQAFYTIEYLRRDLVGIENSNTQFSFRDSTEHIYRELVRLLLQRKEPSQDDLDLARRVIQSLDIAELENYLRCSLVDAKPTQLDEIIDRDVQTAAIYPIILDNRLEIILKLPNQPPRHRWASIPQREEVENILERLFLALSKPGVTEKIVLSSSQQVYDWLIRPVEADLSEIKTLVFVLDSSLRKIPMGVLYDREQKKYLVERYATAVVPTSQLLDPKRSGRKQLNKALLAGLTKKSESIVKRHKFMFPALNNTRGELKSIKEVLRDSEILLDSDFKTEAFQSQLNSSSYTIVHLATHGNFSSDPKLTFILTASEAPIDIDQLRVILRRRSQRRPEEISLLVLSACQTAAGDRRATLGLAGVAVRSGAGSTLGTLWKVDDESTSSVMSHFYQELAKGEVTKAVALQHAQQAWLKSNQQKKHPYFWAPYVLVGNWL